MSIDIQIKLKKVLFIITSISFSVYSHDPYFLQAFLMPPSNDPRLELPLVQKPTNQNSPTVQILALFPGEVPSRSPCRNVG